MRGWKLDLNHGQGKSRGVKCPNNKITYPVNIFSRRNPALGIDTEVGSSLLGMDHESYSVDYH